MFYSLDFYFSFIDKFLMKICKIKAQKLLTNAYHFEIHDQNKIVKFP